MTCEASPAVTAASGVSSWGRRGLGDGDVTLPRPPPELLPAYAGPDLNLKFRRNVRRFSSEKVSTCYLIYKLLPRDGAGKYDEKINRGIRRLFFGRINLIHRSGDGL